MVCERDVWSSSTSDARRLTPFFLLDSTSLESNIAKILRCNKDEINPALFIIVNYVRFGIACDEEEKLSSSIPVILHILFKD